MRRSLAFALSLFCCTSFASELPENTLDAGKVTAQGKPVTLLGQGLKVGADAPNFKVVDDSFTAITLENYQGQAVLISVVPSLDTGICSLQTKHFNEKHHVLDVKTTPNHPDMNWPLGPAPHKKCCKPIGFSAFSVF